MRLVMVNTHERLPSGKGHGLRRLEAHHQRAGQTRPLRGRQCIKLFDGDSCDTQCLLGHQNQIPQMFARCQLRNHAAIFRVQFDLGGNHTR